MDKPQRIDVIPATNDHATLLAMTSKRAYERAAEYYGKKLFGPRGYKSNKDHLYYIEKLETYSILYDEIIVGGLILVNNGFDVKEIIRIFVDPDFQKKGIGSTALQMVMEKNKVKAWTGGTIKWNKVNQVFMKKNGFKRLGEIKSDEPYIWYQKQIDELELPTINSLSSDMKKIVVEGKIVEKALPRSVKSRRRWQVLTVAEATLKDNSGDIVLVLWNEQIKQCTVGDKVRIEGGYVRKYLGVRQLNVGKVGKLITLD
jgi:GNAT superfamily N-acetyltransferase